MKKLCLVLAVLAMASCSLLKKLDLKGADVDLGQAFAECVQKAVDDVKDKTLTRDEKIDVASKSAGDCAKPVVGRFLDK
jgi:hypothetical protein